MNSEYDNAINNLQKAIDAAKDEVLKQRCCSSSCHLERSTAISKMYAAIIDSYTQYIVERIDDGLHVCIINSNDDRIIVKERNGNMVKVEMFSAFPETEMCKYGYDPESGTIKICCLCCFMIDYCMRFV